MPIPLIIDGHALKPGWYQINGILESKPNDDGYYAVIYPTSVHTHEKKESENTK